MAHPFDDLSINEVLEDEEDEDEDEDEDDHELLSIKEALKMMKPTELTHTEPGNSSFSLWVFWNEEDSTLSSDVIRGNIISALSSFGLSVPLVQFWAPVTIDGQRLLTTVNQPFAFSSLLRELCKYRAHSLNCKFNLEPNSNYARVFLSGLPEFFQQRSCNSSIIDNSIVLPVFEPSSTSPVGVLEFANLFLSSDCMVDTLEECKRVLEDVNLTIRSKDYLQCQNIQGLQSAKDEIEKALEIICDLHNLTLAQVWIEFPYMDDNNVPCTSNNEKTCNIFYLTFIKEVLALKVVEYFNEDNLYLDKCDDIYPFKRLCDKEPLRKGQGLVGKSLLTHKPYFCKKIKNLKRTDDPFMCTVQSSNYSCFTICIRSIHTGSLDYVLQFIWDKIGDDKFLLDSIVAAMKRHLPTFKVSSGEELGEDLIVQCIEGSMNDELSSSEISITTKPTPIPESFVREGEAVCNNKRSTKSKDLSREEIVQHYGKKTQKEAAESLGVHLSTLKRYCKKYRINSWQGPSEKGSKKRVRSDGAESSHIAAEHAQRELIQEVNGVNPSRSDPNIGLTNQSHMQDANTINVRYENEIIMLKLSFSSKMTELEAKVSKKLRLDLGTFRLKYQNEEHEWVSITDDEDLQLCMELLNGATIKMYVHLLTS